MTIPEPVSFDTDFIIASALKANAEHLWELAKDCTGAHADNIRWLAIESAKSCDAIASKSPCRPVNKAGICQG